MTENQMLFQLPKVFASATAGPIPSSETIVNVSVPSDVTVTVDNNAVQVISAPSDGSATKTTFANDSAEPRNRFFGKHLREAVDAFRYFLGS